MEPQTQAAEHIQQQVQLLKAEIGRVIVGNQDTITAIITALLCNGHILLEGVPGVAKTTLIKTITEALGLSFKRIQFTPDLLPSDLIGTLIYNQKTMEFETRKGPIFANLILADEINRAPAKVQAALLEAMQERQVTIGNNTYKLEEPFIVFATQNPIEQEGTYRLPEAQVDRFFSKLLMHYPTAAEERQILQKSRSPQQVAVIMTGHELREAQQLVESLYIDDKVVDYILDIIQATRNPVQYLGNYGAYIAAGVSPRATLALHQAARATALHAQRNTKWLQ